MADGTINIEVQFFGVADESAPAPGSQGAGTINVAVNVAGVGAGATIGAGTINVDIDVNAFSQVVITQQSENPKTFLLRARDARIGANGIVELDLIREDLSIYPGSNQSPNLSSGGHSGSPSPPPEDDSNADQSRPGSSRVVFLDIPQLLGEHTGPGFYAAASGLSDGWNGALLFEKKGSEFVQIADLAQRAAIGQADTKLLSGSVTLFDVTGRTYVFDDINTIDVTLKDNISQLVSVSDADLLAGVNGAALGLHGRWEIFSFGVATQLSARKWRLSHLLRGLKGTEHNVGNHRIGDTFVLLDAAIRRVTDSYIDLDVQRTFRASSIGNAVESANNLKFTNSGVSLKPLSPVFIRGEEDASGNRVIHWWDRSRIDGLGGRDGTAAPPPDEPSLLYEVDVLDPGDDSVLRTISSASEAAAYTAAQQTADHGSVPASLKLNIYKISPTRGRGYVGSATISVFAAGTVPPSLLPDRPYRIKCTVRRPLAGGYLVIDPVTDIVLFTAGLTKCRGKVRTAPTASAVFSLQKNDVQFGTMTFSAGQTVAVFAAAADATLDPASSDILTVVAPALQDVTLENLGFTLHGERL